MGWSRSNHWRFGSVCCNGLGRSLGVREARFAVTQETMEPRVSKDVLLLLTVVIGGMTLFVVGVNYRMLGSANPLRWSELSYARTVMSITARHETYQALCAKRGGEWKRAYSVGCGYGCKNMHVLCADGSIVVAGQSR